MRNIDLENKHSLSEMTRSWRDLNIHETRERRKACNNSLVLFAKISPRIASMPIKADNMRD